MLARAAVWGAILLFALALCGEAYGQAGALDTTFGGDGRVQTNFTTRVDYASDVVVQPVDGKIVAAGVVSGASGRFALVRYNTNGTLDTTFGGDGRVVTDFFSWSVDVAYDVVLQPGDGKIVAVGRAGGLGGTIALARYNPNGTLDTSFGGDGKVRTNFTGGDDFAFGSDIQADGKIVVAGRAAGLGGRIAVARYNPNGTLDTSFSADGKVVTNFTRGDDRADLLAVQADGKVVAAGTAGYFGSNARFALVRYNPNGSLDTSFSGDGRVWTNFTTGFDGAFGVAVQAADGRIVAAGQAGLTLALARYNVNGTLDASFSGDGKVRTNFTPGLDYADDVEVQVDGKLVAAGGANFFGRNSRFALARYTANGTLDSSFGGDGKVTTDFTAGRDNAYGLANQPADGKLVAAGFAAGGARFALARYLD